MILLILAILGAIGLFLFGMKIMSEAVQKLAGHRLRKRLAALTSSSLRSITSGALITALVQSSSAVTVMIVSFSNARLLTLRQAIGMVMGANIGTTVTTWIVALYGLHFGIEAAALPLLAVAVPMILLRSDKIRGMGTLLIGLSLMLLSVHTLRESFGEFTANTYWEEKLTLLSDHGTFSPLMFVCAGALLTAALQSSSVTTTLTIVLCSSGVIPFNCALAMILGDNLGTTLSANLAATMTDTAGKRAALSHTLFNFIGMLWALPLLHPLGEGLASLVKEFTGSSPLAVNSVQPLALALFHTLFNLFNTLLLAPFIPQLVRLSEKILPTPLFEPPTSILPGNRLVGTCELELYQIRSELESCIKRLTEISTRIRLYFGEVNNETAKSIRLAIENQFKELKERLLACEDQLAVITQQEISHTGLQFLQILQQILAETRTAAWLNETSVQILRKKKERYIWFNQTMREDLGVLFSLTQEAYLLTTENIREMQETETRTQRREKMNAFLDEFAITLDERYLSASFPSEKGEELQYRAGMIFAELSACIRRLTKSVLALAQETAQLNRFEK